MSPSTAIAWPCQVRINSSKVPNDKDPGEPATDPQIKQQCQLLSAVTRRGPAAVPAQSAEIERLEQVFVRRARYLGQLDTHMARTASSAYSGPERTGGACVCPGCTKRMSATTQETPYDATILVVSKGDEALLNQGGRAAWHFPQAPDGSSYAGYYPADSAGAVAELHRLRARGADFLLFPATAFWWLDHYDGLRAELERSSRLVSFSADGCLLLDLRSPADGDEENGGGAMSVGARTVLAIGEAVAQHRARQAALSWKNDEQAE